MPIQKDIARGMMAFAEGMTKTPYLSNYDRAQQQKLDEEEDLKRRQTELDAKLAAQGIYKFNPQAPMPQGGYSTDSFINVGGQAYVKPLPDPIQQYKNWEAEAKFDAWRKLQANEPLSQADKLLLDIKDPTEKPSEWDLYKQSRDEVWKANGGSAFSGITVANKEKFENDVQLKFQSLKSQFYPQQKSQAAPSPNKDIKDAGMNMIGISQNSTQAAPSKTYVNPKTGERIQWKDGQWQKVR